MLSLEVVRAIADELIPELCPAGEYKITVIWDPGSAQHRLIHIWWDSAERGEDNRCACRGTAVDLSDTEEMVRYRIRAMFANDAALQRVGLYDVCYPVVCDHPDEPPPYDVLPKYGE